MSDQSSQSHQEWEALAAAHALDALEPEDEQRLSAHVATCDICRHHLDDYTLVAAQLGSLADDEEAPPNWQQIRSTVIGDDSAPRPTVEPGGRSPEAEPAALPALAAPRPLWRQPRILAAAAAVVLVAAGIIGWQLGSRSGPAPATAAVTACQQQSGCRVVRLHSGSARNSAAVIVDSGHASVVPLTLAGLPQGRTYVLWQLPRDGSPIAVTSFRSTKRETGSAPLTRPYSDTVAFAVSMEPAGSPPTRPSDILALGAAT
jgi:anti-sigma-K factor RskA